MRRVSVVIPALNEVDNLEQVIDSVPVDELDERGWETEILVVDNASTDGTGDEARRCGARVVDQPERGYGNAYKAGFAEATGDVVVTGDADRTYPLDHIPHLLDELERHEADFMTTNRLRLANRHAMKFSHMAGNWALSLVSRALFRNGVVDSQSGMWVFRRRLWEHLDVRSGGMQFSQELKNEAHRCGATCCEVPIEYRPRGGEVKLNALRDGWANLTQLFEHRFRTDAGSGTVGVVSSSPELSHRGAPLKRVAQVAAVVAILGAVVLGLSGEARHQVALSVSRQPDRYLELAFTDLPQARACLRPEHRLPVRFDVTSHLGRDARIPYVVTVRVPGEHPRTLRTTGSVDVRDGEKTTVGRSVRVPAHAFDVAVTLPGHEPRLLLRCAGTS